MPAATATPAAKIAVGSIATVMTDGLRVRSRPEVSDASKKLDPLLQRGQPLFVVKGPVAGSGYHWYEVQPLGGAQTFPRLPFGWVAVADKTGEPWVNGAGRVVQRHPRPSTRSSPLSHSDGSLASGGSRSHSRRGWLIQRQPAASIPAGRLRQSGWSTCPRPKFIVFDPNTNENSFNSVIEPGLDTSAFRPGVETKDFIAVNLTGHFDDKAAPTCKGISTQPGVAVEMGRDEIITSCRAIFVITGIKRRS